MPFRVYDRFKGPSAEKGDIMAFIYPKILVDKVEDINFADLYDKGYRGVLFDVDNTLVPYDVLEAPDELVAFIRGLEAIGFSVGLVSNNSSARVTALNRRLNLEIMPNAMKPLTFRLKRILKELHVTPKTAVFVGDQLFTDVWVGNSLGLYTVLVKPIQKKEQFITWIKRGLEQLVLKGYKG